MISSAVGKHRKVWRANIRVNYRCELSNVPASQAPVRAKVVILQHCETQVRSGDYVLEVDLNQCAQVGPQLTNPRGGNGRLEGEPDA
jgi:hypothetical protein